MALYHGDRNLNITCWIPVFSKQLLKLICETIVGILYVSESGFILKFVIKCDSFFSPSVSPFKNMEITQVCEGFLYVSVQVPPNLCWGG